MYHVCGKCKHENYRLKSETQQPCTECGAVMEGTTSSTTNTTTGKAILGGDQASAAEYIHGERDYHDVPSEVKIDLSGS